MGFNKAVADHCLDNGLGYDPELNDCVPLPPELQARVTARRSMSTLGTVWDTMRRRLATTTTTNVIQPRTVDREGPVTSDATTDPLLPLGPTPIQPMAPTIDPTPVPTPVPDPGENMYSTGLVVGGSPTLGLPTIGGYPTGGGGLPTGTQILNDLYGLGLDYARRKIAGGNEGATSQPTVPSAPAQTVPGITSGGECPGVMSVKIGGRCVDLTALPPGGDPAVTGQVMTPGGADGYGAAVKGYFGVGLTPRVDVTTTRRCPRGMALGRDGICYDRTRLRKSDRAWAPPTKPLLTGGQMKAISVAAAAGRKLDRTKKRLRKAARALEKGC